MSERSAPVVGLDATMLRIATGADFEQLILCDPYASTNAERRATLRQAVDQGRCHAAVIEQTPVGFIVLEQGFFGHDLVSLVAVAVSARRRGIGLALLDAAQRSCRSPKLFTSTNASNSIAQRLFNRAGFVPSGRIENLDDGDPELIYFKQVAP